MSRCLTCAHWKPYICLMDTSGVRSIGLLPEDQHPAAIQAVSVKLLIPYTHRDGYVSDNARSLVSEKANNRLGKCVLAESESGHPINAESLAVAIDCDDYEAVLRTHETFGCVQFDQATPEQLGTPK